jgi:thymidylate synthase (FAD)
MKLIKPSYKIITPINGEEILKNIELAARTCYKSEGKIEYEPLSIPDIVGDNYIGDKEFLDYYAKSARVLIPKLISRGHEAMLEFGGHIHVLFIIDRGVSHELVRHRIASFAQESTRYCNYGGRNISFIIPCWLTNDHHSNNPRHSYLVWYDAMLEAEETYNTLIKDGWSPQEARSVLPNSLKTEINISCNIREWRHIFKQRTASGAHPQMREVMQPLLDEFKRKIPILFDDITY